MKSFLLLAVCAAVCSTLCAQPAAPATPALATPLPTTVFDWAKMTPTPIPNGERRQVFEGPTATVSKLHCHITTLNPGAVNGAPSHHLKDEIIIIKEGTLEVNYDGQVRTAGPGSVIFFAVHVTMSLRNVGTTPAIYTVISYETPLTPKS